MSVIGMVGRGDPAKGWAAFATVASRQAGVEAWGVGVTREEAVAKFGAAADVIDWKGAQANGREWIGKMDLFVLTSKHEEMPTVVLECFAEETPICGFVPVGGMKEILAYSRGPLREAFIEERDTEKLAAIVKRILADESFRAALVADGRQILESHFDAEKNCRGQLMEVYRRMIGCDSLRDLPSLRTPC